MNRRHFLQNTAFIGAGAALGWGQKQRLRNILFILADDLGYNDLGCYGQKIIRTPNIDQLAREGTRFTNAYAGCSVCAPSRNVLMTGFDAGHVTIRSNPGGVSILPGDVTVAQVLKSAGYSTGMFGKWGLGDIDSPGVPWKHGFDQFFGYLHQIHAHFYYPPYLWDNDKKFPLRGNENGKHVTYSEDVIRDRAMDFLRAHASRQQPFFCYVPFTIPHMEYLVPEDSLDEYKDKIPEQAPMTMSHYGAQEFPRAAYAAMVTRMDRDVGHIMALLRELHLDGNTLVIFTSDNGPIFVPSQPDYFNSSGPLRGRKREMYEGGIRIPAIARWPGRIPAGAVSDFPWYFADVMPTLAELAAAKPPSGIDGISILPTLVGGKQTPRNPMYWEFPTYNAEDGTFPHEKPPQAVRMGDWKVVRPKANASLELYNLKDDAGEKHNLASQKPEVMAKMENFLKTARTEPMTQPEPYSAEWHF